MTNKKFEFKIQFEDVELLDDNKSICDVVIEFYVDGNYKNSFTLIDKCELEELGDVDLEEIINNKIEKLNFEYLA